MLIIIYYMNIYLMFEWWLVPNSNNKCKYGGRYVGGN